MMMGENGVVVSGGYVSMEVAVSGVSFSTWSTCMSYRPSSSDIDYRTSS